jgi:hypothetical protein
MYFPPARYGVANHNAIVNPKSRRRFLTDVNICLNEVDNIMAAEAHHIIISNHNILTDVGSYVNTMKKNFVTYNIAKCVFGWNSKATKMPAASFNHFLQVTRAIKDDTVADRARKRDNIRFWNLFIQPLLDYIFTYKIPAPNAAVPIEKVLSTQFRTCETEFRRKSICTQPVWNNAFFLRPHNEVKSLDSAACKGHMWEFVLIIDRLNKGFVEKLVSPTHFLSGVNLRVDLATNAGARHYN